MKQFFHFSFSFLFLLCLTGSCFSAKEEESTSKRLTPTAAEVAAEECIFDQGTQTDAFLKGIEEFEAYTWNQEDKTAYIPLENGDQLEVVRGGCNHFTVLVRLLSSSDKTPIEKTDYWLGRIFELAEPLNDEVNIRFYKQLLDGHNYQLEASKHVIHYQFRQEQYCDMFITFRREGEETIIVLEHYLC